MRQDKLSRLAIAGFLAFSACHHEDEEVVADTPDPEPITDRDLDGVTAEDGDCDDLNNTIFPGAFESGWDELDSDCDGEPGATITEEIPGVVPFETFEAECIARNGVVQMTAACSGNNACKGMSYGDWGEDSVLTEHSCRGANWCNGWSCVELAESTGLTGQEIYEASCAGCHNWEGPLVTTDEAGNEVETPRFTVMVNPSLDPDEAVATFFDKDDELLRSAIAFGVTGQTTSGRTFTNMPGFHRQMSRSDVDLVIAYVRTMPLVPFVYSYPDGSR